MDNNLQLTDLLHTVEQVGLVVEDLDAKMEGMRTVFGLEPDKLFDAPFKETIYRGQLVDTPARIACYDHFGVQIEYIQPLGDTSIWRDFLDEAPRNGHCLHHIKLTSPDDNDVITRLMAGRGIEVYQEVKSFVNPDGKSTYYDTLDPLGFFVEVTTRA